MRLKRFNENWDAEFPSPPEGEDNFKVLPDETFRDAVKRAKALAMKKGMFVNFIYCGVPVSINKSTDVNQIEDEFVEKYNNKYPKYKLPKKSEEKIFKIKSPLYFRREGAKAVEYAKENDVIVYVMLKDIKKQVNKDTNIFELEKEFIRDYNEEKKQKTKKEIYFNTVHHDVIGLPSGQILYLNTEQIQWLKSCGYITYKTTWKKPISTKIGTGLVPIEINKYTFEDAKYDEIIEKLKK